MTVCNFCHFLRPNLQDLALNAQYMSLCAGGQGGTVERMAEPEQEALWAKLKTNFFFQQHVDKIHSQCPPWWWIAYNDLQQLLSGFHTLRAEGAHF